MAVSVEQLSGVVNLTHSPSHETRNRYEELLVATPYNIGNETGDLVGKEHAQILTFINYCAQRSIQEIGKNGLENFSLDVKDKIGFLEAGRNNFQEYVNNPENYELQAEEKIRARYQRVDEETQGLSYRDQFIARLNSGKGLIYVTDLDGTVTFDPDEYLMQIPGSEHAELLLKEFGRENFVPVFAQVWQPILKDAPSIFRDAGKYVRPLEGTPELIHYLHKTNATVHIDSANFLPVVESFIDNHVKEMQGDIVLWAITPNSVISTDKGNVLKHIALSNPDYTVIHAGDSNSDEAAISAAPYLGGYLAREGLGFEQKLQENQALYLPFKTHYDTIGILKEAEGRKSVN